MAGRHQANAKPKEPMFDFTDAACLDVEDKNTFMPEGVNHVQVTRQAKAICATCPIIFTCLDYAIRNDEWGIWGGTTMKERKYLRRQPTGKIRYINQLILSKGAKDLTPLEDENNLTL